jgi:hypothetical protein
MKPEWFFYIIRFLHFSNNDSGADKNDPNHDRLWKLKNVFDLLPTQSILLLSVWLWTKFIKGRSDFKQDMSDCRCDNSTCYHKELDREVGHGSELYIDKFFFSPDLFDDLTKHKINCCGTVDLREREFHLTC